MGGVTLSVWGVAGDGAGLIVGVVVQLVLVIGTHRCCFGWWQGLCRSSQRRAGGGTVGADMTVVWGY